jgi:hypothetical protein
MKDFNIDPPPNWTPRNSHENRSLLFGDGSTQAIPLYHAVTLRWPELSDLLIQHGSGPQGLIPNLRTPFSFEYWSYWVSSDNESILSAVIRATRNSRGEAGDLLTRSSRLGVLSLVSQSDIITILSLLENRYKLIRWDPEQNLAHWDTPARTLSSSESLWNAVKRADDAQVVPLRLQDKDASLMVNAALCRSASGIDILLKMGFGVNDPLKRHMPWRPRLRIHPLDMVTWTGKSDDGDQESTPNLREEDTFIANMLREKGAVHGWEYTWEYQIFCMLFRTFLPYPSQTTRNIAFYAFTTVFLFAGGLIIVGTIAWITNLFMVEFTPKALYEEFKTSPKFAKILVVVITVNWLFISVIQSFQWAEDLEFDWSERFSRAKYLAEWFHGNCERAETFKFLRIGVFDRLLGRHSIGILGAMGRVKAATTALFRYDNRFETSGIGARYAITFPERQSLLIKL